MLKLLSIFLLCWQANFSNALSTFFIRSRTPLHMVTSGAEKIVIPPDFRLPGAIVALGAGLTYTGNSAGLPLVGIGALLGLQATRVRFEFDSTSMEVKLDAGNGDLDKTGENFAVGGENRWAYDTWTNWEVYPNEKLPILMYFRENQTSPEGQIHFFPFIMDPAMLISEVRKRVPINKPTFVELNRH